MIWKEGYFTTQDGIRLFYRKVGNAGNAIFIPNGMYFYEEFERFAASNTLIFYDVRNRGFSDTVTDESKLERGIMQDVDDLEDLRSFFEMDQIGLIGHSYVGLMIGVYTAKYPGRVNRMIQISPMQPDSRKEYPAHLAYADALLGEVFAKISRMQKGTRPEDPEKACEQFWSILRDIYVANPENAEKIHWGRCECPNERNSMKYWTSHILPSLKGVKITPDELVKVNAPVLVIHGRKDRSAPYGSGRDWSQMLPNARLLTLDNAAHAPWIEGPEIVYQAIEDFLSGRWPESAEEVKFTDPHR